MAVIQPYGRNHQPAKNTPIRGSKVISTGLLIACDHLLFHDRAVATGNIQPRSDARFLETYTLDPERPRVLLERFPGEAVRQVCVDDGNSIQGFLFLPATGYRGLIPDKHRTC